MRFEAHRLYDNTAATSAIFEGRINTSLFERYYITMLGDALAPRYVHGKPLTRLHISAEHDMPPEYAAKPKSIGGLFPRVMIEVDILFTQ